MTAQASTIVIAGSTGLVGREVVRLALANGHGVIALVRKAGAFPTYQDQPHFTEIVADFEKLDILRDHLLPFRPRAFICTLGTTIRIAGSKEAFAQVDRDYVTAFAKLGRAVGATHFGLVSAVDANPDSGNFYLRTKGEAEQAVAGLGYIGVNIVRPSFLLGNRKENRIGEKLGIWATRALSPFMLGALSRYKPIRVEDVAAALLSGVSNSHGGHVVSLYNEMVNRAA
jgi:uncharacterized protein YbjT (DUF2867 family)